MSESVQETEEDVAPDAIEESEDASVTKAIGSSPAPAQEDVSESQVSVRSPSLLSEVEVEGLPDGEADEEEKSAKESSDAEVNSETVDTEVNTEEEKLPRMLGDRYRLESLLAKGGMGQVYRATQLPLERSVAIKVLGSSSGLDAAYRRRFLLEASVCASLTHPNIVVVHDYGETPDGVLFMAMELLEGRRLSQVVAEEGPMSVRRGAFIALQIARALREAHRQGVAHRDLKPGNVYLTTDIDDGPDAVKVFDFGLAKILQTSPAMRDQELTMDGVMMGSPRYMAPEQIRGEEVDARADIYSFGALLYMLLCGRPPFVGKSSIDVLAAHIQKNPPTFAEALRERGRSAPEPIPPELEALAMRCLEKDRTKRYQSIDEPILELKRVLRGAGEGHDVLTSSSFVFSEEETKSLASAPLLGALQAAPVQSTPSQSAPSIAAPPDEKSRFPRVAIAMLVAVILGIVFAVLLPGSETVEVEPSSTRVAMTISSDPPGATVYLDGVRQGVTPFESTYELGSTQTFRFRMFGYEDELVRSEVGDGDVDVSLRSLAPPAHILPSGAEQPPELGAAEPQQTQMGTPAAMHGGTIMQGGAMQATQNGPSVSMRERTVGGTPAAMTEPIPPQQRAVTVDEPGRGLVDDSSRVPLVD